VKRDTHAPARKFSLAVVELLPPDLERGATPRVEARSLEPPVGETRGPSVWDPDGDPRGAYAVPACPQCLTPVRDAETQACTCVGGKFGPTHSDSCVLSCNRRPCRAPEAEATSHEAEAMAREEELSRSTPPDGVAALAATPSAPAGGDLESATQAASTNQNPIDLRNGWSHGEWNGWAAEDGDG